MQKTVQERQAGYIVYRITEHYQNNQFISKEEEIIDRKEPIHKKIHIGTKKIEKPVSNPSSGLERQVFDLVNKARTSNGLNALTWNNEIAKAARKRPIYVQKKLLLTFPIQDQMAKLSIPLLRTWHVVKILLMDKLQLNMFILHG